MRIPGRPADLTRGQKQLLLAELNRELAGLPPTTSDDATNHQKIALGGISGWSVDIGFRRLDVDGVRLVDVCSVVLFDGQSASPLPTNFAAGPIFDRLLDLLDTAVDGPPPRADRALLAQAGLA